MNSEFLGKVDESNRSLSIGVRIFKVVTSETIVERRSSLNRVAGDPSWMMEAVKV